MIDPHVRSNACIAETIARSAPDEHSRTSRQSLRTPEDAHGENGFRCVVPAGHHFALGDNRDSSADSRYWGFVPEVNLVGRAFFVWCSTGRPERMGLKLE